MSDDAVSEPVKPGGDPRPAAGRRRPGRPGWFRLAVVVIGVVLAAVGVWRIGDWAGWFGSSSSTTTATLTLVAPHPGETLYALPIFIWQAIPKAATYNLQVVDENGGVVFAITTADTTVSVPQSLILEVGVQYRWWVRAHTSAGVTFTSALIPFKMSLP